MKKKIIEEIKNVVRGLNDISCVDCKSFNNFFGVCDENRKCDETIFDAVSLLCHFEEYYNKYSWHDLQKDPTDLPNTNCRRLCKMANGEYVMADYFPTAKEWYSDIVEHYYNGVDVIAWREIDEYESEDV